MRPTWIKLFLLAVCVTFAVKGYAQVCTGSLGDPVINETFGSGGNPGPQLGSSVTNYSYYSNDCPNDGSDADICSGTVQYPQFNP